MKNLIYGNKGFTVRGLSMLDISKKTKALRLMAFSFIDKYGCFDVVRFLEQVYQKFIIVEDEELPDAYAKTLPTGEIIIRRSVYERACAGSGRDRFTIAHELGHCFLHLDQISMARAATSADKNYNNSEWQANEFAAQLLMPFSLVKDNYCLSDEELAERFGVSRECAKYRKKKLNDYMYLA